MEWLTRVTALLMAAAIQNWFANDPFFSQIVKAGEKVDINNQSNIRVPREYGRVGNPRQTSMGAPLITASRAPGRIETSVNILEMLFPLAIQGTELRRLDKANVKATLTSIVKRAILQNKVAFNRRLYSGNYVVGDEDYLIYPSFNSGANDCLAPGLEKGFLSFDSPEDQDGSGTYLGWTRRFSDEDNHLSSWYNQHEEWSTPRELADAVLNVTEKARIAHMTDMENPFSMGIMSFDTFKVMNSALKNTNDAGFPTVMYTAEDLAKGRVAKPTRLVNGVPFAPSQWMDDTAFTVDNPMLLLNLDELVWIRNANYTIGEDGQGLTPWRNFLETCGQDYMVAYWFLSGGWYHKNPRACGTVSKAA